MSSTGAGYDYSCGTYSPDGRIYQVEYAQKAVDNSGTAIGIVCRDGVVLAVEKPMISKMLVAGSNRRIFSVDSHIGVAVTGYVSDGRQIVHHARSEAQSYFDNYNVKIFPSVLASRIGNYVHYFTTHGALRPFGASTLIACYDNDKKKPELYLVEPSGLYYRYFGCAAGKGAQAAKTELEKLLNKAGDEGITCEEAVRELAKILYTIRDLSKDKPFELEISWLSEANNWKHSLVPADLLKEADEAAKNSMQGTVQEGEATAMDTN